MDTRLNAELPRMQRDAAVAVGDTTGLAEDVGKLLLRLALGGMLLLHGIGKLQNGIDQIIAAVAATGLPAPLAYLVYVGEVLAPLLLIAGLWTRMAALVIVVNMVAALALVHAHELTSLSQGGGWAIELQGFYLVTALAVALLGAGRFSIGAAGDQRLN